MAEKSHMPYLAIVVLVAVVAVVVLVLNFRPSSEEAVAGEAIAAKLQVQDPIQRLNNAVFQGDYDYDGNTESCNSLCASNNGKTCVTAYIRKTLRSESSTSFETVFEEGTPWVPTPCGTQETAFGNTGYYPQFICSCV